VTLPALGLRADEDLFGECGGRILVSIDPIHRTAWEAYLREHLAGDWLELGVVAGVGGASLLRQTLCEQNENRLQINGPNGSVDLGLQEIADSWRNGIDRRMQ
jgi:hypothetical protein